MTKKEMLWTEIEKLSDEEVDALFVLIQDFSHSKGEVKPNSLMSKLKKLMIAGSKDFAADHDLYVTGEKRADTAVNARYPLRGTPITYIDVTDSVAEADWDIKP